MRWWNVKTQKWLQALTNLPEEPPSLLYNTQGQTELFPVGKVLCPVWILGIEDGDLLISQLVRIIPEEIEYLFLVKRKLMQALHTLMQYPPNRVVGMLFIKFPVHNSRIMSKYRVYFSTRQRQYTVSYNENNVNTESDSR